jgi:hypothetical protein
MAVHVLGHSAMGARTEAFTHAHCHSSRFAQARAQAFLPAHGRRCAGVVRAAGAGTDLTFLYICCDRFQVAQRTHPQGVVAGEGAGGEKAESDEQFEARLARLRTAQGKMPYGESRKREADPAPKRAGAGLPAPATGMLEQMHSGCQYDRGSGPCQSRWR